MQLSLLTTVTTSSTHYTELRQATNFGLILSSPVLMTETGNSTLRDAPESYR